MAQIFAVILLKVAQVHFSIHNRFFDNVIYGDFNYRFNHTMEQTEKYFISLIGDPKRYTKIYVWGVQFSFGFVLNDLNVPYIYCEEAAGMLTRGDVLRNIEKRLGSKRKFWEQCDAYGAYDGSGKNVSGILCNASAQIEGFCADERIEKYDIVSELIKLPKEQREEILSFFNPPRGMQIPKKSTILLTQHFISHL